MKTWTTKDGKNIPYKKLKNDHLLNILKYLKKRAQEGIEIVVDYTYADDDDFMTGDVDMIYDDEALDLTDYKDLWLEAKKRKII